MSDSPAISVAIVTYNSAKVIGDCLRSLGAGFGGIDFEVVIADNASSDDTLQVVRDVAPDSTVVVGKTNRGYAAGVNAAIGVPRATDAILILNPDVCLQPDAVQPLLATLREPATGIAVPKIRSADGILALSLRREPTVLRVLGATFLGGRRAGSSAIFGELVATISSYDTTGVFDWATGAAMLVSRECSTRVGPWDESFFLYSEETDYALRARDAGFLLRYTPESQIIHLGGDLIDNPWLWSLATVNRVELYRRRHDRIRSAAFTSAVALHEATRAATGSRTHLAGLRALLFSSARPPELGPRRRHSRSPSQRDITGQNGRGDV